METMKVTRKQVEPILKAAMPGYTGRKVKIAFTDRVTFYGTNWDGGSRTQYAAMTTEGRTSTFTAPAPWVNPVEGKSVNLPADVLIVAHSIFCGQDAGITIYAHPSLAPKLLTA